jgi:hypothetical protein
MQSMLTFLECWRRLRPRALRRAEVDPAKTVRRNVCQCSACYLAERGIGHFCDVEIASVVWLTRRMILQTCWVWVAPRMAYRLSSLWRRRMMGRMSIPSSICWTFLLSDLLALHDKKESFSSSIDASLSKLLTYLITWCSDVR